MQLQQTPQSQLFDNIASVVTNKRTRSLVFLIATVFMILLINGLLPLISGQARYTTEPISVTYAEYKIRVKDNSLYDMTYKSKMDIRMYVNKYIETYPNLPPEEIILIEPPDSMQVSIYTKFFFESLWWYFDTVLSIVSTIFLFVAMFKYLIIRSKDTNINYINAELTMKQLNEEYLDPDTFEPWIDEDFNKGRKVKQHIRNVKFNLKKLETKTSFTIRRRFKNYFDNIIDVPIDNLLPVPYIKVSKKERSYLNRKEELLLQLDDSYIENYVVPGTVDNFKEIKPGFVYSGTNNDDILQDEYSAIKTDQQRIRTTIASKILIGIAITLVFASLLTILSISIGHQHPIWIVITIITKIVPLMIQIYFALDYSVWFMDNQLLPVLKLRENIALFYLAEMKRRGIINNVVHFNRIHIEPNIKKGK